DRDNRRSAPRRPAPSSRGPATIRFPTRSICGETSDMSPRWTLLAAALIAVLSLRAGADDRLQAAAAGVTGDLETGKDWLSTWFTDENNVSHRELYIRRADVDKLAAQWK